MSRGDGWIERALKAIFASDTDNAFTIADLCDRVFIGINRIERKHRSSLLRALHKLASDDLGIRLLESGVRGRTLIAYSPDVAHSIAMAHLKGDHANFYRAAVRVGGVTRRIRTPPDQQEQLLRDKLKPGGSEYGSIRPGKNGWHWISAQIEASRRDDLRAGRDPDATSAQGTASFIEANPEFASWAKLMEGAFALVEDIPRDGKAVEIPRGARTRRQARRPKGPSSD